MGSIQRGATPPQPFPKGKKATQSFTFAAGSYSPGSVTGATTGLWIEHVVWYVEWSGHLFAKCFQEHVTCRVQWEALEIQR
jgi:hypothetical protein